MPIFRFVIPAIFTMEIDAPSAEKAVEKAAYIVAAAPKNADPFIAITAVTPVTTANIALVREKPKGRKRTCAHCGERTYGPWSLCSSEVFCTEVCHQAGHPDDTRARA